MWTPDNVELLKKLWGYGHSTGQIAARLECSRSAVCAKLQRLGLRREDHKPKPVSMFARRPSV
ncbi:GcrA family cell cycle regulator [Bradyrhizobium sp.]|uniref:GcrA family cell cycle regulator n=1 Tax=Bradyrhizobium sp. TaxID=376 RepID=UPI00262E63A5|nr:GcrA family cell cycle regulator [Bradyrhizobium sp.]